MSAINYLVLKKHKTLLARAGLMETPHGTVETPAFLPVGTLATVKSLTPDEVWRLGAQIVLANAYHLYLRPGADLVEYFGGLHNFMDWHGPILTDSGGFQVFSLGFGLEHGVGKIAKMFPEEGARKGKQEHKPRLTEIDDDGVTFVSHIDGSLHRFTPEVSISVQQKLGADIILCFDECTSPMADYDYTKRALIRTHEWAIRCLKTKTSSNQALFGIVQGGEYKDLREESARFFAAQEFPGYAIGGSLGKSKEDMHKVLEWVNPILPVNKPRHLLGIGEPEDLLEGIERGVDLFDCAMPTRLARHGVLYTADGRFNIRNAKFREDKMPIEPDCECYTCQHFTRGYIRHLFVAEELLAYRLATIHNLHFIVNLVKNIRKSILNDTFEQFKTNFLIRFRSQGSSERITD